MSSAHAEDGWVGRRVAFGDAVVRLRGLVGRCVVTSQSPDTGVPTSTRCGRFARYRGRHRRRRAAAVRRLGQRRASRGAFASAIRWSRCDDRSRHVARPVTLTVADLDAQAAFYRRRDRAPGARAATATPSNSAPPEADAPLVTLVGRPDAPPRPPRTTGLFHLALLVPSRADLARALHRVTDAGHPVHRRVRPSRLGGALPRRPRGQRDRDLPRPAARGVGT